MRMKSILAISAFSAVTFLAGPASAAPADVFSGKTQAQPADAKAKPAQAAKSVQAKPTQAAKSVQAKPAQAVKSAKAAQPANAQPQAERLDKSKHHAHRKGHKHKKHKHKHHKHHRHHHHHHHRHHHEHFHPVHREIPTSNFLVGGSLGYVIQKETFESTFTTAFPTAFPGIIRNYNVDEKDSGVLFGLLAGWQWRCHRWMFGAEASVDFSSDFQLNHKYAYLDSLGVPGIGTILYDRGDIYALTARIGYFVTPFFMPYVRVGGQLSHDEVSYQTFYTASLAPDFSSRTKDVYGYVVGAGAEFPTYIGSSTIRFEYNFVETQRLVIEDNSFPALGGSHKFHSPESHVGKISFVWNFL
ncbi:MAG: hypothetical protein BGO43_02695 [Gammaproteobacteria bacterium 39-13]|nr:outer membrane beta-barrel protein [Gammaproteobacteria bacterium]OJV85614.1 MAG: hypothetical protein BGO43_02695 [Gammaproteobacteria bacterium 39-13]